MISNKEPNGKFGMWKTANGGLRLAFYRSSDGLMTAEVFFDREAIAEFESYLHETLKGTGADVGPVADGEVEPAPTCPTCGCRQVHRYAQGGYIGGGEVPTLVHPDEQRYTLDEVRAASKHHLDDL